jgi:Domain of unknown function (DUF4159)
MMLPRCTIPVVLAIVVLAAAVVHAQSFGWRRGRITQNQPPNTELVVARWHFGTNGNIGHMGWSHNYPNSDRNLNEFLKRVTNIDVDEMSFRIVELGSDEVFNYPFAYVSEPGEMELTDQEVMNLREFVDRGGFVLIDDFDGTWQLEQMVSQMRRAFPERQLTPLHMENRLFHTHFDLDDLQDMSNYVPGGYITYLGLYDDHDRLAIAAGHNNDLANFWEWYNDPSAPLSPGADAFRLGSNAALYAMAH